MARKHPFHSAENHPLLQTLQELEDNAGEHDPDLEVLDMSHFWALINFIQ